MKRFADMSLTEGFAVVSGVALEVQNANDINNFDVEVGVNDFQVAPKNTSIGISDDVPSHAITGYIDMGDHHSVFSYNRNLMTHVVDLVRGLDSDSVKSIKLFMPKKSEVLDFNQRPQKTYAFKLSQIESSLFVKNVDYEIAHTPFVAPKVEKVAANDLEQKKIAPKVLVPAA